MVRIARDHVRQWVDGSTVDLGAEFMGLAMRIIAATLLSEDFGSQLPAALATPLGVGKTYHLANRDAVRFVDVARMGQLKVVEAAHWQAVVSHKAPEFSTFAHRVCMAEANEASGSVELRFQHNRLYDNTTLRSVMGERFISLPPVNEAYVETLWTRLRRT
jgi:hypothetical protein